MNRQFIGGVFAVLTCIMSAISPCNAQDSKRVASADGPMVETYLKSGELAKGEVEIKAYLEKHPQDDQARFGLGTLQFIEAIERLSQSLYRYGSTTNMRSIPFLRISMLQNDDPQEVSYQQLRAVFKTLLHDLTTAEATLGRVKDPAVKQRLQFGLIRLDLNGDGRVSEEETLWKVYANLTIRNPANRAEMAKLAEEFAITFDKGDCTWLRGYCHLLMALDEFILAHDWEDAFDRTALLFFPKPKTSHDYLIKHVNEGGLFGDQTQIADAIALIHMIRFPVSEPKRLLASQKHLQQVITLSKQSWQEIAAETDDVEEWVPNANQVSMLQGTQLTQEMIDGWKQFLDEADQILTGKKLVPHWRLKAGRGINLDKYFKHSKRFDLVLIMQGTDIGPYLEEGTITDPQFWWQMQRLFRGNFLGFAVWIN